MGGTAEKEIRGDAPGRVDGQIVLPQMHAVGPAEERHVDHVVDHHHDAVLFGNGAAGHGGFIEELRALVLLSQLDEADPPRGGGLEDLGDGAVEGELRGNDKVQFRLPEGGELLLSCAENGTHFAFSSFFSRS